jgi:hypothetical protein
MNSVRFKWSTSYFKKNALTTTRTAWEINLDSNVNKGIPSANATSKWSLVIAKTRKDKLKKHGVGRTVKPGHSIDTTNRYAPLTNLLIWEILYWL